MPSALRLLLIAALLMLHFPLHALGNDTAGIPEIRALIARGELDPAVEAGEALVERTPADSQAWLWLGRAYGLTAQQASLFTQASWAGKCRRAYEKAVELDGANLDARFDLMTYYAVAPGIVGGDADAARAQALAIMEKDRARGHEAQGTLAQMLDKDLVSAEREFHAALVVAPDRWQARMSLTSLLMQQERAADAVAIWDESLVRQPEDPVSIYMAGRTRLLADTELPKALAFMDRYLALPEPHETIAPALAHWRRGLLLEKLGRIDDARAALTRAVQLDPELDDAKRDLKRLRRNS